MLALIRLVHDIFAHAQRRMSKHVRAHKMGNYEKLCATFKMPTRTALGLFYVVYEKLLNAYFVTVITYISTHVSMHRARDFSYDIHSKLHDLTANFLRISLHISGTRCQE